MVQGIEDYSWERKSAGGDYDARYVTHDVRNKRTFLDELDKNGFTPGKAEKTQYKGTTVKMEFQINRKWAQVYTDESFQETFEDFEQAIDHFFDPDQSEISDF